MTQYDIGIDYGTDSVVIYMNEKGIVLNEPSVVAYNSKKEEIVAIGKEAYDMLGKAPPYIEIVRPLENGAIANFLFAEALLNGLLKKVFVNLVFKPCVCICVPSTLTNLERKSFVNTAKSAGARKVFLIEEPVAAAIGCGLDIREGKGKLVVDIGAGSTDIAVISLGGVVHSVSVKIAGYSLDEEIIKMVSRTKNLRIGQKTAEMAKKAIGTVSEPDSEIETEVKGVYIPLGLPRKIAVNQRELYDAMQPVVENICTVVHDLIEKTPPELLGDIMENGIYLTGGTAKLKGIKEYFADRFGVKVVVPDNADEAVAVGTGLSFDYTQLIVDGFRQEVTYEHE